MRTDPITETEWRRIRHALPIVVGARTFETPQHQLNSLKRYETAFDALWALGCHPSVLAAPKAHQLTMKLLDGGWVAQWKRPKTRNWCIMPVSEDLAREIENYADQPYSRKAIWQTLRAAAEEAGLPGVTPLTIRHSVAIRIFQALGPAAAKDSLQVGDRALQHYTALTSGARVQALRKLQTPLSEKTV